MKIVMFGAPGAGKGTLSEMISEKYKIPHISTGDMFRQAIADKTELGKKITLIAQGNLVPDDITISLVKERLSKEDCKKGFVLDGFPRTTAQAAALDKIAKPDFVINLEVSEETIIKRLSARRTCEKCKAIYNIITNPPKKEGVCDKCSGRLLQRDDDKKEVIKKRLGIYMNETSPVLDYYLNEGLLYEVDGEGSPEKIFEEIKNIIEKDS